jgi:hypothetical protein
LRLYQHYASPNFNKKIQLKSAFFIPALENQIPKTRTMVEIF